MKRNDDSKIRCPLRGTVTILKTFGMWLVGLPIILTHKIRKQYCLKTFLNTALLLLALVVVCGAGRQPVSQNKGNVISETMKIVAIGSTAETKTVEVKSAEVENAKTLKSNEEIAKEVILGIWGNGEQRSKRLSKAGYNPEKIQVIVDSQMPKQTKTTTTAKTKTNSNNKGGVLTKRGGVCYNNPYGYKETWYSQRVLPGGGLRIPGRHVDSRGLVCDKDGYICVAVNVNDTRFPYGSVMQISLGMAKVYDHGCAKGVIDVYVDW